MTTRTGSRAVIAQEPQEPRGPQAPPRRPFAVLDELASYHDSPSEPINVHVELWLPGHLDAQRLREAVAAMLAGQPRARARRAAGGWWRRGYTWEFPAEADLDPVSTISWQTEEELDSARVRLLSTAPPVYNSPPFRLLLARGPERDSLILNANHVAVDGRSCLRLLGLIADQYSTPGGQRPPAPDRGDSLASHEPQPAPPPSPVRRSVRLPARIARQHAAGRWPRRAPGYGVGMLAWPGVPSAPTPRTQADGIGDAPRATVNDLLIAALIQTVTRWNAARRRPPRPVRISMPVDIRPPGGEDELGNLSRLCTVTAEPAGTANLTAVVAGQTQRAKREPGPKEDPALAVLAGTRLPVSVKRRLVRLVMHSVGRLQCDTSLLSNLGNVTDPPRFGPLVPQRIWFSTSAHMPRGLSVGVVTIDGRLQLCFRYRYALLDAAAARDFVAEYANALSALTETRTETRTAR
jgi:NRPS condensation-like uncharacterized protein